MRPLFFSVPVVRRKRVTATHARQRVTLHRNFAEACDASPKFRE